MKKGFKKCYCEYTLFVKTKGEDVLIVSVYVDDLIYMGSSKSMMEEFKRSRMEEFAMIVLGRMKYFLGVEVIQDKREIFINQKKYAEDILVRFGMEDCNSVKNPIILGQKLTKKIAGVAVDPTQFK